MKLPSHQTAKPSHYNKEAESYDAFNEKNSYLINQTIETILKNSTAKTVLDLTCGTGSQVFWLARAGFTVVGCDINAKMLKIAKQKAQHQNLDVRFFQGDMRTAQVGEFDAVITIFNTIGHLTKADFEQALRNIHSNLKEGGLYIFDIANLTYFLTGKNISDLTIDWITMSDDTQFRDIQYSIISTDGILRFYTTSLIQKNSEKLKISKNVKTLQIYSAEQLKEMLTKHGFNVIEQCDIDGSKFIEDRTDRILTIAEKI